MKQTDHAEHSRTPAEWVAQWQAIADAVRESNPDVASVCDYMAQYMALEPNDHGDVPTFTLPLEVHIWLISDRILSIGADQNYARLQIVSSIVECYQPAVEQLHVTIDEIERRLKDAAILLGLVLGTEILRGNTDSAAAYRALIVLHGLDSKWFCDRLASNPLESEQLGIAPNPIDSET